MTRDPVDEQAVVSYMHYMLCSYSKVSCRKENGFKKILRKRKYIYRTVLYLSKKIRVYAGRWEATTRPEGTFVRGGNVFCVNGSSGDTVSTLGKFQPTVPDTLLGALGRTPASSSTHARKPSANTLPLSNKS